MGGGGGREVGGGKEELIDRAQVLAVCACATSSPVWQAESHLQAHTARGRAISTQSPRAQPPAARARAHTRAQQEHSRPRLARSCKRHSWQRMGWEGCPTGLRLGGWAQPTPALRTRLLRPLKRTPAITGQNPPVEI